VGTDFVGMIPEKMHSRKLKEVRTMEMAKCEERFKSVAGTAFCADAIYPNCQGRMVNSRFKSLCPPFDQKKFENIPENEYDCRKCGTVCSVEIKLKVMKGPTGQNS
jgi:hypothetical protein